MKALLRFPSNRRGDTILLVERLQHVEVPNGGQGNQKAGISHNDHGLSPLFRSLSTAVISASSSSGDSVK
jgi:hypothetical protein